MKSYSLLKKIGLLGLTTTLIAVFGTLESIMNDLGWLGILISIGLSLLLFFICFFLLQPILVKNARGVTLLESLKRVGLTDIENRNDEQNALPPKEFLESADREIALSGLSAARTFDQNIDDIKSALRKGKQIYILIMHPDCDAIRRKDFLERRSVKTDILQTISIIKQEQFIKKLNFHIRFMKNLPQFTSVMIDGDINPMGDTIQDQKGQIRIQSTTNLKLII